MDLKKIEVLVKSLTCKPVYCGDCGVRFQVGDSAFYFEDRGGRKIEELFMCKQCADDYWKNYVKKAF